MRKSNFFHFIISLFDGQQHRIQVQKAVFKDFYDTLGSVSAVSVCTVNICGFFVIKLKQKVYRDMQVTD